MASPPTDCKQYEKKPKQKASGRLTSLEALFFGGHGDPPYLTGDFIEGPVPASRPISGASAPAGLWRPQRDASLKMQKRKGKYTVLLSATHCCSSMVGHVIFFPAVFVKDA